MTQAITGVAPPELGEVTNMIVWPSIARFGLARTFGKLYSIRLGIGNILTLGNLIALASIPAAIALYFWRLNPLSGVRYRLTNKRVVIERGPKNIEVLAVSLDRFDAIEVEVLPGQAWYHAGDLIFRNGPVETFRISGVQRPETFRQTCLKARQSFVGVQQALEREAAMSA